MTQSASGYDPIPPPAPPKGVGPDKWWNPFAPSWPPAALGRAAGEALRKQAEEKSAELMATVDEAQRAAGALSPPDPIAIATAAIGEPSWGYYVPSIAIGALSVGVLAAVGAVVYKKTQRSR